MLELLYLILPSLGYLKSESFPEILSREEEIRLLDEMAKGSQFARAKLIEHNLRLVAHITKKYESTNIDKDDLLSIGTIGLVKGIDSFKTDSLTKISTYIARCIENEILMYLRSQNKKQKDCYLYDKVATDLEGNSIMLMDVIEDQTESIEECVINEELKQKLRVNLPILDKRELEIISLRYGLNGNPVLTQKEIAKQLRISRSYVSRIEKRALMKLYFQLYEP